MMFLFNVFSHPKQTRESITYSGFLASVERGNVAEVTIQGDHIYGNYIDGKAFKTFSPEDPKLISILRQAGVRISAEPKEEPPWYVSVLISWFPMVLLIAVWLFFMKQMQAGTGRALLFGRSKAKVLKEQAKKVTFEDVAGIDESKEELREIIDFLKDPKRFTRLGGRIPKGVLLMGAPGTGKTLLARAIAGEAGVPFFSISGSDFVEMFVGVGAARVRDLFIQGKKHAPCIIFIDEIDAVGRHRGAGLGGGHDEREQTLNQLLVEMDGFESNEGVILISATNRPDVLDPALLRPGRFDRQVVVPVPDVKGREEIFSVHTRKTPLAEGVDLNILARGTPGFTGADIENVVNEAALIAARYNKDIVDIPDFERAKDKVIMGSERRSLVISEEEKKISAYHEAGHALVAKLLPEADPIHKVTIIPRGRALGLTQQLPTDERHNYTKEYLLSNLSVLLGGRTAEELVFKELSTGAANDLEKATDLARKMVCDWGMSEELGPLTYGKREEQIFLGKEMTRHKEYSERTAVIIDAEVKKLVMECYHKTKDILTKHMNALHALASALLEKETLDAKAVDGIIGGVVRPLRNTPEGTPSEDEGTSKAATLLSNVAQAKIQDTGNSLG
jgi:cell division protease FtsH